MSIHTSYFGNIKSILKRHPHEVLVSIAGKTPSWFKGCCFLDLAPKKWWWKIWHDSFKDNLDCEESRAWYSERYKDTVLDQLDPFEVVEKLTTCNQELTTCNQDLYPANVTILCYETPEKFCHRHLVAEWLNSSGAVRRPVIEWLDGRELEIKVAEILLRSIGLDLKLIANGIWTILPETKTLDGIGVGMYSGDIAYIFEQLMCEHSLFPPQPASSLDSRSKNPYFGLNYEELCLKATVIDPSVASLLCK